ncbi:serine carboxypeptidase-like 45 [Malania oleifera]|uniref:serine carboxypeptidase-like 45 n=1 Tax=Malania oleifera TaxID=397392 RepID=UPI0025ADB059|nr:serine carboxypeptidase-like 45 [Malania oleifera]
MAASGFSMVANMIIGSSTSSDIVIPDASDHMASNLSSLDNIQLLNQPCPIKLPNADIVPMSFMGESHSLYRPDKVGRLPRQPGVNFQQYSGYVTVDDKQTRFLFYYFVEAETNPASKPLVLWLNGGPGCSSIGTGAFMENGPFKPGGDALIINEHSWNKEANMLYLESPAGVGFSYSTNISFYSSVNDNITAHDNLVFLDRWLAKYPDYRSRDLYITGESYAGHYVSQLAQLIVQSPNMKFNLKGIALGNPLLDFEIDFNSVAEFWWSHGLISDSTYELFRSDCNFSQFMREYAITGSLSRKCYGVITQSINEVGNSTDTYDVTLDVCLPTDSRAAHLLSKRFKENAQGIDVCIEDKIAKYLNRKDVQRVLHAKLVGVNSWISCSKILKYDMHNLETSVTSVVGSLVQSGIRTLIYSGDQDSLIPLIGTRTLVNNLAKGLGLNTTVPYSSWFVGGQVGGRTQAYGDDNILSFASIKAASHQAPYSQPQRSLELFRVFLSGKSLPT